MPKIKSTTEGEKIELQMTPMIDVVFQLLIFFILSFKITTPEGDFNIKMMPLGKSLQTLADEIPAPPLTVRLEAGSDGQLASLSMGDRKLKGFDELHNIVLSRVGDAGPSGAEEVEVELDCDYDLKYEFVVEAITAVSGRVQGNAILPLVQKIKFASPRKAGG